MKTNKEIFEELSKQYTDEELVEAFVVNETLDPYQQKEAEEEFRRLRLARLKTLSPQDVLVGRLLQMKYTWRQYFKQGTYQASFTFALQLKKYIELTGRSSKVIAENLGIHPTRLSRILNEKENPNVDLMYRLEKHSDGELPAHYWWKLHAMALEHEIKTDLEKKLEEAEKVQAPLNIRG